MDLSLSRIIHELHTNRSTAHSHDTKLSVAPISNAQQLSTRVGFPDDASIGHESYVHGDTMAERPLSAASAESNDATGADDAASGTGARRRRNRAGFAPLTESEKRVKQRQLVKRSYYRKIVRRASIVVLISGLSYR